MVYDPRAVTHHPLTIEVIILKLALQKYEDYQ